MSGWRDLNSRPLDAQALPSLFLVVAGGARLQHLSRSGPQSSAYTTLCDIRQCRRQPTQFVNEVLSIGCRPRLMLNVIFRIRLAGRFRRVWRWRLSRASMLASVVGTASCDHHGGGPKGGTSNHAFRLRRQADAPLSLLRGGSRSCSCVPTRGSRKCHAAG